MVRKIMKSMVLILVILIFTVSQVSAQRTDEFNVVMNAAIAKGGTAAAIKAANLKTALDANDGTTPLVLDVRDYNTGYAAGHIPGAVWVGYYRDLGKASVLNDLDSALATHIAAGKKNQIVTYGNTRHISRMVAGYLETQGYTVAALRFGLSEWTSGVPTRFIECTSFDSLGRGISPAGCTSNNFATELTPAIDAATRSGEGYANLDNIAGAVTSADLAAITRAAYDARFGDPTKPEYRMTARELYELLDDNLDGTIAGAGDDLTNDPFVLSNRGTTWASPYPSGPYYTAGHIVGAVGVDWADATSRLELRTLDATDFMPTDRTVVHHCWVGISQQYGGAYYNLLGYTVRSLDWGIQGWTTDVAVRATNNIVVTPLNYPVATSPPTTTTTTTTTTVPPTTTTTTVPPTTTTVPPTTTTTTVPPVTTTTVPPVTTTTTTTTTAPTTVPTTTTTTTTTLPPPPPPGGNDNTNTNDNGNYPGGNGNYPDSNVNGNVDTGTGGDGGGGGGNLLRRLWQWLSGSGRGR